MANQKLLEVFLNTKSILCKSDYYIHVPKNIIHVTNSENMIPHLMGMQYIGRQDMFTGDKGAYMIKKGRLKYDSLEKLVKAVFRMNVKFGKYHTMEQLVDVESLFKQCSNKREESLVEAFFKEWKRVIESI